MVNNKKTKRRVKKTVIISGVYNSKTIKLGDVVKKFKLIPVKKIKIKAKIVKVSKFDPKIILD